VVPKLQILDLSGNAASLLDGPAFSSLPYLQELYLRLVMASVRRQLHTHTQIFNFHIPLSS